MKVVPGFADIEAAAKRVSGKVLYTPLVLSDSLSHLLGGRIYLKLESLQPGGSFKLRGATNAVGALTSEQRARGVVAASSGNYGTALAIAASHAGIGATIVLPDNAPEVKVERIRRAGATIVRHGSHYGDSEIRAAELVEERGLVLIHPFDDTQVVAGQGTIALELHNDAVEELDGVAVPVGGGGLVAGVALGLKYTRPNVEVIGVEPAAAPSLTRALEMGTPVAIDPLPTCADGLSPRFTGDISCQVAAERIRQVLLLSETELLEGVRYCFEELKLVVEPSGAAGVAALIAGKLDAGGRCLAVIVSGSNLDRKYYDCLVTR